MALLFPSTRSKLWCQNGSVGTESRQHSGRHKNRGSTAAKRKKKVFFNAYTPAVELIRPPIQQATEALPSWAKRQGTEAEHFCLSSAETTLPPCMHRYTHTHTHTHTQTYIRTRTCTYYTFNGCRI